MNSIVDFFAITIKLLLFASVVAVVVVFWGYNKIRLLAESVKEALANISISTREKVALIKNEREAYKASTKAFYELCAELRDCEAVLRNARTSYEETLTKAQREVLQYAKGWQDREAAFKQEQANLSSNGKG